MPKIIKVESIVSKLTNFEIDGNEIPVTYVETQQVRVGVECDIYTFAGDASKDLAIVRVDPACCTPLQKVMKGTKTIKGFISGTATLTIGHLDGSESFYNFTDAEEGARELYVGLGETMQWRTPKKSSLTFYEICEPPYEDGRFENLA